MGTKIAYNDILLVLLAAFYANNGAMLGACKEVMRDYMAGLHRNTVDGIWVDPTTVKMDPKAVGNLIAWCVRMRIGTNPKA